MLILFRVFKFGGLGLELGSESRESRIRFSFNVSGAIRIVGCFPSDVDRRCEDLCLHAQLLPWGICYLALRILGFSPGHRENERHEVNHKMKSAKRTSSILNIPSARSRKP